MLNFDRNLKIPLLAGHQLLKYLGKNVFIAYLSKMCYLLPKNLMGVSDKHEILHTSKLSHAEKKTSKSLFYLWPPTWSKKYLKFTNIFLKIFIISKYLAYTDLKKNVKNSPAKLWFQAHTTPEKKSHLKNCLNETLMNYLWTEFPTWKKSHPIN